MAKKGKRKGKGNAALNECLRKQLKGKKFGSRDKAKAAFSNAVRKCKSGDVD